MPSSATMREVLRAGAPDAAEAVPADEQCQRHREGERRAEDDAPG